ncbi:MAPEG family protein [Pseudoxanthomonas sp. UTMC 1351]|uniref:MAPEG family protein n=1 Tax=Pseudoxanthomonas sp. UTMC 1351 TaxID=2695853 RepID=UPI0034CD6B37
MNANTTVWLWPAVAMAALTFLVWCRLYYVRLGEMRRRRIPAQALANSADVAAKLSDTRASDNFRNLFELPVLFYAGTILAAQVSSVSSTMLALAWSFVVLRAAHSLIHCTFNHVMSRFVTYLLATFSLWIFWALLAWRIWQA